MIPKNHKVTNSLGVKSKGLKVLLKQIENPFTFIKNILDPYSFQTYFIFRGFRRRPVAVDIFNILSKILC